MGENKNDHKKNTHTAGTLNQTMQRKTDYNETGGVEVVNPHEEENMTTSAVKEGMLTQRKKVLKMR